MQSVHITDRFNGTRPEIIVHETEMPTFEGRLAIVLIEKWGLVAAIDSGEDSSGRAKARLLTPSEVVSRACETADLLAKSLRERGWVTIAPSWDEAQQIAKDMRRKEEEQDDNYRAQRAADRAAARSRNEPIA